MTNLTDETERLLCSSCHQPIHRDQAKDYMGWHIRHSNRADCLRALQDELNKCRERQIGNCAPELYEAKLTIEKLEARVAELERDNNELLKLTRLIDEHPDDYNGPCECKLCESYANAEGETLWTT